MAHFIEYRNARKREGATLAELALLDGYVRTNMKFAVSDCPNTVMMNYRLQRQLEGATNDEIALLDKHIYASLGTKVGKIVDICGRLMPDKMYTVSVDINNETVGHLKSKFASVMESNYDDFLLIFRGQHLTSNKALLLSEIGLTENDIIGICKAGAHTEENCCFISYNMLCDSLMREMVDPLKGLSDKETRMLLAIMSIVASKDERTKMLANAYLSTEPWAKEPLAKEPLAKEPLAKESLAKEPLAKEPLAKEPLAKDPLAKEPSAKEPLAKDRLSVYQNIMLPPSPTNSD
jgi:hypothetical protein